LNPRKQKLKRWVSLILTAIMLLSILLPANVSAAEEIATPAQTNNILTSSQTDSAVIPGQGTLVLGDTPLANITFSIYETTTNQWFDFTSDANGGFTYNLPNGTYKIEGVWVTPTWYVLGKTFTIQNGLVDGQHPLTIDGLDYEIPVGAANVIGTLKNGEEVIKFLPFSIHSSTGVWYDAKTDKNGRFAFELPDGNYQIDGIWVDAERKWYELNQPFTVTNGQLEGASNLVVDIATALTDNVTGTLTKGTSALSNLTFSLRNTDGTKWYSTKTDANGQFILTLPKGSYTIEGIWDPTEQKWYVLQKDFTVETTVNLDINVYTDGPINQTPNVTGVLKKGTEALAKLTFSVRTTTGDVHWYDITTDASGSFSTILPNGTYRLEGIWVGAESKWYALQKDFTVDGTLELTIDVLAGQQQPPAGEIVGASIYEGFALGSTAIHIPYQPNAKYAVKVANGNTEFPKLGEQLPQGTVAYQVGDDIKNVTAGQFIQLYQVDDTQKITHFFQAEIKPEHIITKYRTSLRFAPQKLIVRFNAPLDETTLAITDINTLISSAGVRDGKSVSLNKEDIVSMNWNNADPTLPSLELHSAMPVELSYPYIAEVNFYPNKVKYAGTGTYSLGVSVAGGGQLGFILVPYIKEIAGNTEDPQKTDRVMKWLMRLSLTGELSNINPANGAKYQKYIAENNAQITNLATLQTIIDLANGGSGGTPPGDTTPIVLEDIALVNGLELRLSTYDVLKDMPNIHQLSFTNVESSNPAVVESSLTQWGDVILAPKAEGTVDITINVSNGKQVTFTVTVNPLQTGLAALNAFSLEEAVNIFYAKEIARAIIEGTPELNVNNNVVYAELPDHYKNDVAEWVIRQRPAQGYQSATEFQSVFQLVVATVNELNNELKKYRHNIDLLSNVPNGTNGQPVPVDVTNKLLYMATDQLNSTINRQFRLNGPNDYVQLSPDGKILLTKNNTTTGPINQYIPMTLEKNGMTVQTVISAKIVQQSVQLTAPIVNIRSYTPVQVTRPNQPIEIEVTSDYQIEEIFAEQNGQRLEINYWARGGQNTEIYQVKLNEVQGADQTITITVRLGNQTGTQSAVLKDFAAPMVKSVEKNAANKQFIVTFSEPVEKYTEFELKDAFNVSQGEVVSATQTNDTTFVVEVTDIQADYLAIPNHQWNNFIDKSQSIYSGGDFFIFNPTTALINSLVADWETEIQTSLNMFGIKYRKAINIVDGDSFNYADDERADTSFHVPTAIELTDSKEQLLATIDAYFRSDQHKFHSQMEYLGTAGWSVKEYLTESWLYPVAVNRDHFFFAKFKTASGDIVYLPKNLSGYGPVTKNEALTLMDNMMAKIPTDLNSVDEDDAENYVRNLEYQFTYVKQLGATDQELQALTHYSRYEALKQFVEGL
jgi:hypothetical protein